jgi:RimJ/RimL family protein N-acetyltransferase
MTAAVTIETARLRLRGFREDDRVRYAALVGDPEVGAWLGGTLTHEAADAAFDRAQAAVARPGLGLWAVERRTDGVVIGEVGLNAVNQALPVAPAIEMSWRMFPAVWGQGYASEAATAVLAWGLVHLPPGLDLIAFTAESNHRSQAVMRRIGLERDRARDFEHPLLALGHPLRSHIVYVAERAV